jgi:hypothetical protein
MIPELKSLLDALEKALDPQRQARTHELHQKALRWEKVERLPLVLSYPFPASAAFRPFSYRDAFHSPDRMLFNELTHAFSTSIWLHTSLLDDLPYTVRANCGTGVIASLFGARIELVEDNPPWVRALEGDVFARILDADPGDLGRGLCPRIIAIYEHYHGVLRSYPNLQRCLNVVLPDLQGPFDTFEMLCGSGIYADLYEKSEEISRSLAHIARAQVTVARRLRELTVEHAPGFCHQHGFLLPGNILIRNDSAINISPAAYSAIIAPHDAFVLEQMDGGGIHFCGRGQHLVPELLKHRSLTCLDLGQSALNDVEAIHAQAATRRIPLTRVQLPEGALLSGRSPGLFAGGASLTHHAASFQDAQRIWNEYSCRKLQH